MKLSVLFSHLLLFICIVSVLPQTLNDKQGKHNDANAQSTVLANVFSTKPKEVVSTPHVRRKRQANFMSHGTRMFSGGGGSSSSFYSSSSGSAGFGSGHGLGTFPMQGFQSGSMMQTMQGQRRTNKKRKVHVTMTVEDEDVQMGGSEGFGSFGNNGFGYNMGNSLMNSLFAKLAQNRFGLAGITGGINLAGGKQYIGDSFGRQQQVVKTIAIVRNAKGEIIPYEKWLTMTPEQRNEYRVTYSNVLPSSVSVVKTIAIVKNFKGEIIPYEQWLTMTPEQKKLYKVTYTTLSSPATTTKISTVVWAISTIKDARGKNIPIRRWAAMTEAQKKKCKVTYSKVPAGKVKGTKWIIKTIKNAAGKSIPIEKWLAMSHAERLKYKVIHANSKIDIKHKGGAVLWAIKRVTNARGKTIPIKKWLIMSQTAKKKFKVSYYKVPATGNVKREMWVVAMVKDVKGKTVPIEKWLAMTEAQKKRFTVSHSRVKATIQKRKGPNVMWAIKAVRDAKGKLIPIRRWLVMSEKRKRKYKVSYSKVPATGRVKGEMWVIATVRDAKGKIIPIRKWVAMSETQRKTYRVSHSRVKPVVRNNRGYLVWVVNKINAKGKLISLRQWFKLRPSQRKKYKVVYTKTIYTPKMKPGTWILYKVRNAKGKLIPIKSFMALPKKERGKYKVLYGEIAKPKIKRELWAISVVRNSKGKIIPIRKWIAMSRKQKNKCKVTYSKVTRRNIRREMWILTVVRDAKGQIIPIRKWLAMTHAQRLKYKVSHYRVRPPKNYLREERWMVTVRNSKGKNIPMDKWIKMSPVEKKKYKILYTKRYIYPGGSINPGTWMVAGVRTVKGYYGQYEYIPLQKYLALPASLRKKYKVIYIKEQRQRYVLGVTKLYRSKTVRWMVTVRNSKGKNIPMDKWIKMRPAEKKKYKIIYTKGVINPGGRIKPGTWIISSVRNVKGKYITIERFLALPARLRNKCKVHYREVRQKYITVWRKVKPHRNSKKNERYYIQISTKANKRGTSAGLPSGFRGLLRIMLNRLRVYPSLGGKTDCNKCKQVLSKLRSKPSKITGQLCMNINAKAL